MKKSYGRAAVMTAACVAACVSCAVDYDVDASKIIESNCLVVNGILNPSKGIDIWFYTLDRQDGQYVCRPAEGVSVKLTENGRALYEGVCADRALLLNESPKAGAVYRIEAQKAGYAAAQAETAVPKAITCDAIIRQLPSYRGNTSIGYLYDFSGGEDKDQSAIYITSYERQAVTEWNDETYESTVIDSVWSEVTDLYSRNLYIDIINRIGGMPLVHEDVGSLYFENFMRVRAKNIPALDTLVFSTAGEIIRVLTASVDYDRYLRTAYEQSVYRAAAEGSMGDVSAMFYQPVKIHSNINGGVGIFAGVNERIIYSTK